MTGRWLAFALAGAACFGAAPISATTMFEQKFTCPVGGEKFEDYVIGSSTSWGQRPDGRSYGTLEIYPVVECPGNGFLLFEEAFAPDEVARLEPLVAGAQYQAMRRTETPHFRVWWLMEKLGRDPYDRAGALLRASWESDEDPDRKARYQTAFVAAATGLTRTPEQAESWFWFNLRAANALRELGDFPRAEALLAEVAGSARPKDADEREGAEFLMEGLRVLIAEGNAAAEPANLIPPEMAVERCTTEAAALSASERAACAKPATREAIAENAEYEAREASGKTGEGKDAAAAAAAADEAAAAAAADAASAAAAADLADSGSTRKGGKPKTTREGK